MRRLNRALLGFHAGGDELREVARQARELAARLEQGPERDKRTDMEALNGALPADGSAPAPVAIGQSFEFDPFSIGGGRLHPSSVGLELRRDGDTSIVGTVTIDPMFQGPPERAHGGVVALLVDEMMGSLNRALGQRAFTARLALDLRAPTPVGTPLTFRAWLIEREGRKIRVAVEGRASDAVLFVEAQGLFVAP